MPCVDSVVATASTLNNAYLMYADSAYGPTKLVNLGGGDSMEDDADLDFLLSLDADGLYGPKYFFWRLAEVVVSCDWELL